MIEPDEWAHWFPVSLAEAEQSCSASCLAECPNEAVCELLEPWLDRVKDIPISVEMDNAWEPIPLALQPRPVQRTTAHAAYELRTIAATMAAAIAS